MNPVRVPERDMRRFSKGNSYMQYMWKCTECNRESPDFNMLVKCCLPPRFDIPPSHRISQLTSSFGSSDRLAGATVRYLDEIWEEAQKGKCPFCMKAK